MNRLELISHYKDLVEAGFALTSNNRQIGVREFVRLSEAGKRVDMERLRDTGEIVKYENVNIGFFKK